jgi:hypothetical protein
VFGVCIPFRRVFLAPVYFVRVLLTPTCHVSGFPWQGINDGQLDLMTGLILQLMQPCCYTSPATQNHCYNETRTGLTARSRSLLTPFSLLGSSSLIACMLLFSALILLLLNVEIYPLIVELRGLEREHLVQGLSFVFNSALASVASESNNSVYVRCSGNVFLFLGNTLILFLASGCSGKTRIEPLPGNGRLCCFPTSIFLLLGIIYRTMFSNSQ